MLLLFRNVYFWIKGKPLNSAAAWESKFFLYYLYLSEIDFAVKHELYSHYNECQDFVYETDRILQMTIDKELLETCDVCSNELSKRAESCPHCGDPKFQGDPVSGCISGVTKGAVALIVLAVLGSFIFSSLFK